MKMRPFMGSEDTKHFEDKLKEGKKHPFMVEAYKGNLTDFLDSISNNDRYLDVTTYSGLTVMHFVALNTEHNIPMAIYLENRPYFNASHLSKKDCDGEEPIHYAIRVGNYEFARYVIRIRWPKPTNLLHFFVMQDNLNFAKLVHSESNREIRFLNSKRKTLLHYAAQYSGREMCEWLVEKGASIHIRTLGRGATVVHFATKNKNINRRHSIIAFFKSLDKNLLDVADANGETPLHWALRHEYLPIADSLLEIGGHHCAKNKKYKDLLLLSESKDQIKQVELVLQRRKGSIKIVCMKGRTTATHKRHLKNRKQWLIKRNVKPSHFRKMIGANFLQKPLSL
ncbi:ankyrin-1-like [Cloeon dipterum]|uniref:ankyrin-1-like n=1 Tax=Cloeon dipterum TaxID=197152 RepID=UPI003220954C